MLAVESYKFKIINGYVTYLGPNSNYDCYSNVFLINFF